MINYRGSRAIHGLLAALALLTAAACSSPDASALLRVTSFAEKDISIGVLVTGFDGDTDSVSVTVENVTSDDSGATDILIDTVRVDYIAPNGTVLPTRWWRMTASVPAGEEATIDDVPVAPADLKSQLAAAGFTPTFTVQASITVSGHTGEGHEVEAVGYLPIRFE